MASSETLNPSTFGADGWHCKCCITWIDKHINDFSNKRYLKLLIEINPDVETFENEDEGARYLRRQDEESKTDLHIVIVSGALSRTLIPRIQKYKCVYAIFIYCRDVDAYQDLKFDKLEGIHTDFYELIDAIEMCTARMNERTYFNVFVDHKPASPSDPLRANIQSESQRSIRNLKENQASFIWFFQMQEFMISLDNDDDENAKAEMIEHSLQQYKEQSTKQKKIEEFKKQSLKENRENAIASYTANSFIHECVNTVLRKENISQVYRFRFIIKLICQQLRKLHRDFVDQYRNEHGTKALRVYRGQYIQDDQIDTLTKSVENLISLNGFVSTSRELDIAKCFIANRYQEGFTPVIFEIDIDMANNHSVAFADISHLSKYSEEKEVLLSIGAIFHVDSVRTEKYNVNTELYFVRLSLKQHNQLPVIKYIQLTYGKNVDKTDKPVLFGKLLFEMGESEAALMYFRDALDRLTEKTNHYRPIFLNNIGVCYNELKQETEALKYYKKAQEIYRTTNNERGFIACQLNIASIYHAQGKHKEARRLAEETFSLQNINALDKASCYNLIGCIYLATGDFDAAVANFQDALELRSKYLGKDDPHHPDIGISHHNISKAYRKLSNFKEANVHFKRAEEIFRRNYAANHPLILEIEKTLMRYS